MPIFRSPSRPRWRRRSRAARRRRRSSSSSSSPTRSPSASTRTPNRCSTSNSAAPAASDFRRRVNGGGPVYAGAGSAFLIYFLPVSHPEVPATTEEAFRKILTAVAGVFRDRYGFAAEYRPLNDIQVEGRKLVPTSLKIEDGVMTLRIVVNVKPIDTGLAGRAMPMPPEKVRDKALKTLESRFTWLEREAVPGDRRGRARRVRYRLYPARLRRVRARPRRRSNRRSGAMPTTSGPSSTPNAGCSPSRSGPVSPACSVPATRSGGAARRRWAG